MRRVHGKPREKSGLDLIAKQLDSLNPEHYCLIFSVFVFCSFVFCSLKCSVKDILLVLIYMIINKHSTGEIKACRFLGHFLYY